MPRGLMDLWMVMNKKVINMSIFFYDFDIFLHKQILPRNFTCKLVAQYKAPLQFSNWEHLTFKKNNACQFFYFLCSFSDTVV